MGLFGSKNSVKWECEKCGKVHKSNPEQCTDCEHTILIQHRPNSSSKSKSSSSSSTPSGNKWKCKKCGHSHNRKPFTCDECNASTLAKVANQSDMNIPEPPEMPSQTSPDGIIAVGDSIITWLSVLGLIVALFYIAVEAGFV